jgi:hypothetical protein
MRHIRRVIGQPCDVPTKVSSYQPVPSRSGSPSAALRTRRQSPYKNCAVDVDHVSGHGVLRGTERIVECGEIGFELAAVGVDVGGEVESNSCQCWLSTARRD